MSIYLIILLLVILITTLLVAILACYYIYKKNTCKKRNAANANMSASEHLLSSIQRHDPTHPVSLNAGGFLDLFLRFHNPNSVLTQLMEQIMTKDSSEVLMTDVHLNNCRLKCALLLFDMPNIPQDLIVPRDRLIINVQRKYLPYLKKCASSQYFISKAPHNYLLTKK
jgi:hypothetical protein